MLDHIVLKFGETPTSAPLEITPGAMTVLVGPNNSGKSLTLREISRFIRPSRNDTDYEFKIVESVRPQLPKQGSVREAVLAEIEQDIQPFRGALAAAKLTPREVFEGFHPSHVGTILNHVIQFGQLRRLAEQDKIDPSLLDFDIDATLSQPSLAAAVIAFLREIIAYIERHDAVLTKVVSKTADEGAGQLVSAGAVRMTGYLHHFAEHVVLLDGKGRLSLTDAQETHSLHETPQNIIMRLFSATEELEELRRYVFDAFQRHLAIDATGMVTCRFVLADEAPGKYEKSLSEEAKSYFRTADDMASMSDGVKSYVGLHATLLSRDDRVILVDEPEAFLHPPLARRLGANLTKLAASRGATVIAATHSPFFLMGCIEAGHSVNVVRLGYRDRVATARSLSSDSLHRIMNDPLLRSTRVLDALFHQSAVVCEGDSDQAFYDEINERLRREAEHGNSDERYARDCLFINSHGKQSIDRLMGMLRRMGIPSAGVVDLDVVRDRDGVAGRLLHHAGAGKGTCDASGQLRFSIYRHFEEEAKRVLVAEGKTPTESEIKSRTAKLIKEGGIKNLSDEKDRRDLVSFLRMLGEYGVFALEQGELEAWLPELGQQNVEKKYWLENIFAKMGSQADPETYVAPRTGDVWDFVRGIAKWLDDVAFNVPSPEVGVPLNSSNEQ